jgi:hypothetical protein
MIAEQFFPQDLLEGNQWILQNKQEVFFRLEQPNTKMQSEVIKVSDSKEFFTAFSGLSNEDIQKVVKQFII